jgi:hypothetical protein
MKRCRTCGRRYKDHVNYCVFCGKKLPEEKKPAAAPPPAPKTVCVTYRDEDAERRLLCSAFPALIGRDSSRVDIPVLHPSVSRTHCRLIMADGSLLLEDVGSSNGTFINGARIQEATPVGGRDAVRLGDVEVSIRMTDAGASEEG